MESDDIIVYSWGFSLVPDLFIRSEVKLKDFCCVVRTSIILFKLSKVVSERQAHFNSKTMLQWFDHPTNIHLVNICL